RGIYATIQARTARPTTTAQAVAELAAFYAGSPFVAVGEKPPRLQDVAGTNRARIGLAVRGDDLVAFSAIDNLVKGAAGGGVQWMNRLLDLPEVAGLAQPGLGWI
ncbi:MAG TPA: Asd/ArgC dimerization domain-containing protein, partial [Thermoanaerobaculia bacterium]|nr:Asd/ArgC dimerization domain-containing protein [Thermoanaerobaculia bacterium]